MKDKKSTDGRERLTAGLLFGWASHLLQVVAGFLIPRMIDGGMGPVTLGIWDFGWSLVSYFGLLQGGVGSAASRFLAVERARKNRDGVNRIVSSAALVQRVVAGFIFIVTIVLAWGIPYELKEVGDELERDARWLVFLLGSSVSLGMIDAIYTGVLTGCKRWKTHHSIYGLTTSLSVIGMLVVLKLGFGIIALGVVHLSCEFLGRMLRRYFSYRACPELKISMTVVTRSTIREILGFGGRLAIGKISRIVLVQTTSILIVSFLGPAALAIFVRPRSLVRQAAVFPQKYSYMLTPAVASLFGAHRTDEVRNFVISSSRTGLYMSVPIIVFLALGGPSLMSVWMGADYANPWLIGILTLSLAAEVFYQPLDNLMIGLNLHGRPALVMMGAALLAVLLAWIALANGGGLVAVALAIGVPWTFAHGIYLPLYTCKRLDISVLEFFRTVWFGPLAHVLPFGVILAAARWIFPQQPLYALLGGGFVGGGLMAISYWIWVLPDTMKHKILSKLKLRRFAAPRPAAP